MIQQIYEFAYQPTTREIRQAMALGRRQIYRGVWRVLSMVLGMFLALGAMVLGVIVLQSILRALGVDLRSAVNFYYLALLGGGVVGVLIAWAFNTRLAQIYVESPMLQGASLSIGPKHIVLGNRRSQNVVDWRDIPTLVVRKNMVVAVLHSCMLVVPFRLVEEAGIDPKKFGRGHAGMV